MVERIECVSKVLFKQAESQCIRLAIPTIITVMVSYREIKRDSGLIYNRLETFMQRICRVLCISQSIGIRIISSKQNKVHPFVLCVRQCHAQSNITIATIILVQMNICKISKGKLLFHFRFLPRFHFVCTTAQQK